MSKSIGFIAETRGLGPIATGQNSFANFRCVVESLEHPNMRARCTVARIASTPGRLNYQV
jgi:hypothetical protein